MSQPGYFPLLVLAGPGDLGHDFELLGGALSPCSLHGAWRRLYLIGSPGPRDDGGGPRDRALGAVDVDERARLVKNHGVVLRFGEGTDPEAGFFSAAVLPVAGKLDMVAGEIVATNTPGEVDGRAALYRSSDGLAWNRVGTLYGKPGEELFPVAAYRHQGKTRVFHCTKQRGGWTPWQLGVDDRKVNPRILTRGASGPFPMGGGQMKIILQLHQERPGLPRFTWATFAATDPWNLRLEPDWPVPPGAVQVEIEPGGFAYVRDSTGDRSSRIVVMAPTDDPSPLELSAPYNLHTDPIMWPATAEITGVRYEGGNLRVETKGISGVWPYYEPPGQDRAYYGHAVFVVKHAGRWIKISPEHVGNKPGQPYDVVDDTFEGHGVVPSHPMGPGHRIQKDDEVYFCFAAHCRVDDSPDYPHEAGTVPQRTRWVRLKWGTNGFTDVEPAHWFPDNDHEDDDMPYPIEDQVTETIKLDVPEGPADRVERVDFTLPVPIHADMVVIDPARAEGLHAFFRLNGPGGRTIASLPPGAPAVPQHRTPVTVQGLTLVVNREDGNDGGGTVRVIVSGRRAG